MFVRKLDLVKDLQAKRTFVKSYDTESGETMELTEREIEFLVDWILNFPEAEVVECGKDYWMDHYNFYSRFWTLDDGEIAKESFVIERKEKTDVY